MVAVDVMGGDYAPQVVLEGALRAARSGVSVMLFGPEQVIRKNLLLLDPSWASYSIEIIHAPQQILMDEEPVGAVRKKRDSSLVKAVASVKAEQSVSVISAGNSGALMVAASLILGRQPGIERPAIAGLIPALKGPVLAIDLGANTECRAHHLFQFAQLGVEYAKSIMGIAKPRVGLLANGSEDRKGTRLTKEAFCLLKKSSLNFIGNVEPDDILRYRTDIVVCDGFAGNVLLKTMESMCSAFCDLFKNAIDKLKGDYLTAKNSVFVEKMIEHVYGDTMKKINLKSQGGALLLGVNGRVIVCHGNSDAFAIERAIRLADPSQRHVERVILEKFNNDHKIANF